MIDWGAEDASLTCTPDGQPTAWAKVITSPDTTHYVVDVRGITIGSTPVTSLPIGTSSWQQGPNGQSIVDSCTTKLIIPNAAFQMLTDQIQASSALQKAGIGGASIKAFLFGSAPLHAKDVSIQAPFF